MKRVLADAQATALLGEQLASAITPGIIYMQGDLGAGKTTLARGLLRALGHTGKVRSPTYTLVEPYVFASRRVYHLDLYRLADAEELEWLGLRDMLAEAALLLVEWPERGSGFLPSSDLSIDLEFAGGGREARLLAATPVGQHWLDSLAAADSD
jgi:tRNA threonylcarbamoyladenosine biosynthesis protein TsaE